MIEQIKIPKIISKDNHEYILIKEYPNFIMYKDTIIGTKKCFDRQELGLVKQIAKPPKTNINVEKVKL